MKKIWFILILVALLAACAPMEPQVSTPTPPNPKYSLEEYGYIEKCVWEKSTGNWICPVGTQPQDFTDCEDSEFWGWSYIPGEVQTVYTCQPNTYASFCVDGLELGYPVGPYWSGEVTEEIQLGLDFATSQMPVSGSPTITVGTCQPADSEVVSTFTGK
jgi:hypothetical protein